LHYTILLTLTLLIAPLTTAFSPTNVMVSFHDGRVSSYSITDLGGRIDHVYQKVGIIDATLPQISVALLRVLPGIDFVEPNSQVVVAPASVQDGGTDNFTGSSHTASNEYSHSWGLSAIGVKAVHDAGFMGKGVKVAELDTGIDYKHPDLAANYMGGINLVNGNNDPMDDNGHGTHVAGIIAAARNNFGTIGVAPQASLYAVKVSDSQGKGTFDLLVQGINWAIENHMNVITMSITGSDGSEALKQAVTVAHDKYGIVLVAAVGNGSSGGVLYPAEYDAVIGVGSVTRDGSRSSFSLTGNKVELVAPGSGINSTWFDGKYKVLSGTSMATPFVTGTVALILGSDERLWKSSGLTDGDGKWTPEEVRNVLDHMTKHLGSPGRNDQYGYGELSLNFPTVVKSVKSSSDAGSTNVASIPALSMLPRAGAGSLFGSFSLVSAGFQFYN
jgi:subtilisin family serine protease